MKIAIERNDLLSQIQYLASIVPSKNTMPILTNFLIEAEEEQSLVKITATDLEITVVASFSANVMQSGRVAVSAKNLAEIVHALPDSMITIVLEDDQVKMNCGKIDFSLLCADVSQFPLIPQKDLSQAMAVNAQLFSQMIEKTMFAVSTDNNRPIFTGVYWQVLSNEQVMVATDGKKIAEMKTFGNMPVEETVEQVLPIKGLNFLQRIISDDIQEIKVLLEPNRVMFSYGRFILFSHVIEGKYPDYRKVFPEDLKNSLIIDKNALKNSVKRIALMAAEDTLRIKLDISMDRLEISALNRDMGEAKEVISDLAYIGEPVSIAFNHKFLQSILNVIDSDKARILFGNSKDPVLIFNDVDPENTAARYLLMPLRLV